MLFTRVTFGLEEVLSVLLGFASEVFPFCSGRGLFLTIRAPFLAFLKRTDVRRPTPTGGPVGGLPSGVTSWTASGWEEGVSPISASSSP